MRRQRRRASATRLLLAVALLQAAPAHAAAPAPGSLPCAAGPTTVSLVATFDRRSVIDLHLFGAGGAPVSFFECVGDRAVALGQRSAPAGEVTRLWAATGWRCDRLDRRFAATVALADGTIARGSHAIRTASCAQRFGLEVPGRLAAGSRARVRLSDRWRVGGVRTSLCIARPGRRFECDDVVFRTGNAVVVRAFRVAARGRWRVELRAPGHTTRRTIAVGVRAGAPDRTLPTLLATGDSTMGLLSNFLSDRLGDVARVVSAVEPGIAISKADAFQPMTARNVARFRPSTTVVSVGANEGWAMPGADGASHACCDAAWVDEYVRRVRTTMLTLSQRVFWLTVVAPKDARRAPIAAAVNTAIVRAAEGLAAVHVLRMDLLFTPDGYREVIRYGGRDVRVREPDGVHLNVAGAEIAAREVVKAMNAVSGG